MAVLVTTWHLARKRLIQSIHFGATAYICFFVIGYSNYQLRQPNLQLNHYYHSLTFDNTDAPEASLIEIRVSEVLKPDRYNNRFIGKVCAINGEKKQGKLILNVAKDSCWNGLTVDDSLLIYSNISEIPKPRNPHQFDYGHYMKTMDVHGQVRIQTNEIVIHNSQTTTIKGYAEKIRAKLISKLKSSGLKKEERVIVQALILGERREISGETNSQYAAAGAIHLLAVSGLHVGIVFMLFRLLLAPLNMGKAGKKIKALLLILSLYSFALLAGFSPSVVRSATMFSLFIFSELVHRRTDSINTLFISYFGLLLMNPAWLFQVGFQLSYLAVFFILWIQPKLYGYLNPKNYFLKLFWGIITVSIAAQIGVLPLSLYYFHQFPGLFLLTNIVVLPLISLILIAGILFIVLELLSFLPNWYVEGYSEVIKNLNRFIAWTAKQDSFLFEDITFSGWRVLCTYFVLISVVLLWKKASYKRILFVLSSVAIFFGLMLYEKQRAVTHEMVIFHKSRQTLIAVIQNEKLRVFTSDTNISFRRNYPIKNYYTTVGVDSYSEEILPKAFSYKNKTILILDSLGVYPSTNKVDIVLLTESPKINLNRLIDSLKPVLIVADGSNYNSFVARWEQTCNVKKLPFHHTGTKGALIFE